MKGQATAPAPLTDEELTGWFAGRLPDNLFAGPPTITADRDEILIVGELPEPDVPKDATEGTKTAARSARTSRSGSRVFAKRSPTWRRFVQRDQTSPDPAEQREQEALDAYSRTLIDVAAQVAPSVACVQVLRPR